VAMHRMPPSVPVPAELVMFSPEDWPGADDETWVAAYVRWADARRAYAKAHPDSALGTVLDQLRFERRVRFAWSGAQRASL
jgi:hypothetical protein